MALPHLVSTSAGLVNADDVPCSFAAIFDGHRSVFAAKLASTRLHDLLAQGMPRCCEICIQIFIEALLLLCFVG